MQTTTERREGPPDPSDVKKAIREQAHANRRAQESKDELSAAICEKFIALPEFEGSASVMVYIDVRAEVRTRQHLPKLLEGNKRIVVPALRQSSGADGFRNPFKP